MIGHDGASWRRQPFAIFVPLRVACGPLIIVDQRLQSLREGD